MERAIRVVSVERGHDPRDFALVGFGGCGGLHACEIAAELGISAVIIPQMAGALSALGMLLADRARDYSASALDCPDIDARFRELERSARKDMPGCRLERSADLRYMGQSYELNVPWRPRDFARPFHEEHEKVYGYSDRGRAVEIVTVRVKAAIEVVKPAIRREAGGAGAGEQSRRVRVGGKWLRVPVFHRADLSAQRRKGPALVVDYGSTTLIPPGWQFILDRAGNLIAYAAKRPAPASRSSSRSRRPGRTRAGGRPSA
jgi:N-methylhydantoinase A